MKRKANKGYGRDKKHKTKQEKRKKWNNYQRKYRKLNPDKVRNWQINHIRRKYENTV